MNFYRCTLFLSQLAYFPTKIVIIVKIHLDKILWLMPWRKIFLALKTSYVTKLLRHLFWQLHSTLVLLMWRIILDK